MADSTKWEELEAWLVSNHTDDGPEFDFSAAEYAAAKSLDEVAEASEAIQEHLGEQRKVESNTLFVLRRVPGTRTLAARWAAGARTKDARLIGDAFISDVQRKVDRAMKPDLDRIREINPRAAQVVESQIDAIMDGAMKVLAAAAQGTYSSGDHDDE